MKINIKLATLVMISALLALSVTVNAKQLSGKAPDFTLKTLEGKQVKLSDYKGQVVMINFWATWCGPCRQEMPHLEKMYSAYKKARFVLFALNIDDSPKPVKKYLKKSPVSFPVLLDPTTKVVGLYQALLQSSDTSAKNLKEAMPSSYFIDSKGNLAYYHKGYHPGDEKIHKAVVKKLFSM